MPAFRVPKPEGNEILRELRALGCEMRRGTHCILVTHPARDEILPVPYTPRQWTYVRRAVEKWTRGLMVAET